MTNKNSRAPEIGPYPANSRYWELPLEQTPPDRLRAFQQAILRRAVAEQSAHVDSSNPHNMHNLHNLHPTNSMMMHGGSHANGTPAFAFDPQKLAEAETRLLGLQETKQTLFARLKTVLAEEERRRHGEDTDLRRLEAEQERERQELVQGLLAVLAEVGDPEPQSAAAKMMADIVGRQEKGTLDGTPSGHLVREYKQSRALPQQPPK
jgi:hypothetical protein